MIKKKSLLLILLTVVLLGAGVAAYKFWYLDSQFCNEIYFSNNCAISSPTFVEEPHYKEESTFEFLEVGYECSKPIKMVSNYVNKDGAYVSYKPADEQEARVFCHTTYAIEYKGKLKVLQKPEVLELINKYPYKDVSIKALEFKYIQDKEFVHRLLPEYANKDIGCIILLDTPGEDKVFLEDEELETFEEIDYATFANQLEKVSAADRQLFYDNLK